MTKALVARGLAARVKDGEIIGLGSGSTAELAIEQIGQRIAQEKIRVSGVPTSYKTALIAERAGIQVLSSCTPVSIAWAFDGADEVDPSFMMIKGNGAAMLNEKIMARRAGENMLIIVSEDKLVEKLGKKFAVPVEVIAEAVPLVREGLKKLGARSAELRESNTKYGPQTTEHNNLILDAWFDDIRPELEREIKLLLGVVESGLFVGATKEVLIAKKDGVYSRTLSGGKVSEKLIQAA